MKTKTYTQKPKDIKRSWYILDASTAPLGWLASKAAVLLMGKHKAAYTPHIDGGDYVIIINTAKAVMTGSKLEQKSYFKHSGYPGSIKDISAKDALKNNPNEVVKASVRGMLADNKLRPHRIKRLKLFAASKHGYDAQKPTMVEVASKNYKLRPKESK